METVPVLIIFVHLNIDPMYRNHAKYSINSYDFKYTERLTEFLLSGPAGGRNSHTFCESW